jgi:outer membrane lipase/esterase
MPTDRWSSFIAGDVILADLSHNANLEDANYTTGNVTAGVDYRLDEHFTVGALFAYSHTDASLDSRGSSATVDSYSPGIYASYVDKGWYGNFLGAYGRNAYTSDRMVDIPGLQGDNHGGTSGNQGTINLTGGYEFQRGAFKFGPVASVQYVHLALDSMQEQGPTALSIDSQDEDSFRSQLGVEGRFNANVGPVSLTPHLSLSWQHEYLDSSRGINAQFTGTGGGSFVTQTDNPDRDAAFIDVGLDAEVAKNVTVFVDYETQAGQNNFFAQSAQGGVRIGF